MNISPSLFLEAIVQSPDEPKRKTIENHEFLITNLARLKSLSVQKPGERPASAATTVIEDAAIFIPLEGIIDFTQERLRLEKEITKITAELATVLKKLNNEDFLNKAPEQVIQKVQDKHKTLTQKQQKLQTTLDKIQNLI
jgi:valyl-tRNA synthetase